MLAERALRTMTNALWFVTGTSMSEDSPSVSGSSCVYRANFQPKSNHVARKALRVDKASGSLAGLADQTRRQAIAATDRYMSAFAFCGRSLKIRVPGF